MNEIANWVLWSIGLVTVAVAAFFGIFWAVSYIAFIVMESRRQKTEIADRFYTVYRWMSGFKGHP